MLNDLLPAMVAAARRSADERERQVSPDELERQAATRQPMGQAFRDGLGQSARDEEFRPSGHLNPPNAVSAA